MQTSKFNWKPGAIITAILFVIFIGVTAAIKADDKFPVEHKEEVKQTTTADGRSVAGYPEHYKVKISLAQAWDQTKGFWRTAGLFLLLVCGAFITILAAEWIVFSASYAAHWVIGILLVLSLACYVAAYSSAFSNNWVELTPAQYDAVKDNLEAFFKNRELIR